MNIKKFFASLLVGAMCIPMINVAHAENSAMLWNAEFDGNDDMSTWTKYLPSDSIDTKGFDFSGSVADGEITVGQKLLNYGRMGFEFADAIDVADSENIYWETKFCYVDKAPTNDDKMFILNDEDVLIGINGGELQYGGEATGFAIEQDTWYTLLVKMNFVNDEYAIEISGDNQTEYDGNYVSFTNGNDITSINSIKLPRQRTSGLVTKYDYVRIWDEDNNFSVNVTHGENDDTLDSAVGLDTEFDFKVEFSEAVTAEALAGISINNGGVLELVELSEDGYYATYHVSALDYGTEYMINIPAIGNNPEKELTFTTGEYIPPEINVVYGIDDENLDGAVNVSKTTTFKILFALPITEADAAQITIDNDAQFNNMNLSNDGRVLTMTADGLAGYTKYTISIPELAGNAAKDVSFTTVDDISYILKLDFNGQDDTSGFMWTPNRDTSNPKDLNSKISNGTIKVDRNDMGSQHLTVSFDNAIDAAGRENLYFEERVRYTMVSPRADGLVASSGPILNVFGTTTNYQETVFAKDGKLSYGGVNLNSTLKDTNFEIKENEWYTIRLHLNNATKTFSVSIEDDYGNKFDGITDSTGEVQNSYGLSNDTIYHVLFGYTADLNIELDYIKIWDSDIRITSSSIKNGDVNVSNDSDVVLEFSKDVNKDSLSGISVNDSDGNIVPVEITADDRKAVIYFSAGLKYDEDYTLTVPTSVTDTEGKNINETIISFKTEPKPMLVENHGVEIDGTTATAHATAVNTTNKDKKVCIVMVVYDKDGNVIMMKNVSENISATSTKEIYAECEIGNAEDVTVKAYVWNGK